MKIKQKLYRNKQYILFKTMYSCIISYYLLIHLKNIAKQLNKTNQPTIVLNE